MPRREQAAGCSIPAKTRRACACWRSKPRRPGGGKNNRSEGAGGVRQAMERARTSRLPIEIEVRTKAELAEALEAGATHLLLDNLTPGEAAERGREIGGRAKAEL